MTGTSEKRWDGNFEAVRRFRDEHERWPKQKRDGALGGWCDNQRTAKKGKGDHRISPAQIAKLDGIGFVWSTYKTSEETVEQDALAAEPQQPKKAVPSRKRVHKADPEGRSATRPRYQSAAPANGGHRGLLDRDARCRRARRRERGRARCWRASDPGEGRAEGTPAGHRL